MADLGNGEILYLLVGIGGTASILPGCNRLSLQFEKTLVRGPPSIIALP
jgi:hypothetical protein